MRSRFTGRVHNGDHLSRSVKEEKEFLSGNTILDNATNSMYSQTGAFAIEGTTDKYFDVYFLSGCSMFTHFKAYAPGRAHLFLGVRRPSRLLREKKIRKGSKTEAEYFNNCRSYGCELSTAIGVRIYADRSYDYLFADGEENMLVLRNEHTKNKNGTTSTQIKLVSVDDVLNDKKSRRNSDEDTVGNNIPKTLSTHIMFAPDIDEGERTCPTQRCGVYSLSERAKKIVEKVFPENSPLVCAFAEKQGDYVCSRRKITTGKHLHEFITTPLRVKSQKTHDTLNEIKTLAAGMFEDARPYRRRLSSQYALIKICGDWLITLIRQYASNHYEVYAMNLKTNQRYAINTAGASMPFVVSRISKTRVILQGTEESLDKTQLGKIIKANPPSIDRREADVAGLHIVTFDTCLLSAMRKGYGNFIEQAASLDLKNIISCILDDTINAIPKYDIEDKKSDLRSKMNSGRYYYYYRDDMFDSRAVTLNSGATNLAKAFDLPMAKVRLLDKLLMEYSRDNKTDVRLNLISGLFNVNLGSLDDETFKQAVLLSVKSSRSNSSGLMDLFRELPESDRSSDGLVLLKKMAAYSDVFGTLRDYWRLRKEVKNIPGVTLDEVGFPLFPDSDRVEALHNRLVQKRTEYENLGKQEKLKRMNKAYEEGPYKKAKKLDFEGDEGDNYIIVACKKVEELDIESNTLHHCVSSYKDSVANGVEYIAFLRKKKEPEIPYITMDIDPRWKVRQIHGKYNSDLDDMDDGKEIKAFLEKWVQAKDFIDKDSLQGHYGALCHL